MAKQNAAYWGERSANLWLNLEKDETALLSKLDKQYDEMLNGIDKEISSYFSKYGYNNTMEYVELLKDADAGTKAEIFKFWDDFAIQHPEYAHLAPARANIYKLTRLQALQTSILQEQVKIGVKTISQVKTHLVNTGMKGVKLGYEAAGKMDLFNQINPKTMEMLVNSDWTKTGDFSSKVWGDTTKLNGYMGKDFTQAVVRGDSYDSIIKGINTKYAGVAKSNIRRLVYTEGTFVLNESLARGFESNFDEYEYNARMDEKTSTVCKDLNGKIFKFAQRSPGENFPPMHPNCRSTFLTVIPEEGTVPVTQQAAPPPIKSLHETNALDAMAKIAASKGYASKGNAMMAKWDGAISATEYDNLMDYLGNNGLDMADFAKANGIMNAADYMADLTAKAAAVQDEAKKYLDQLQAKKGWVNVPCIAQVKGWISEDAWIAIKAGKEASGMNWADYIADLGYTTTAPKPLMTAKKLEEKIKEIQAEMDGYLSKHGYTDFDELIKDATGMPPGSIEYNTLPKLKQLKADLDNYTQKLAVKTGKTAPTGTNPSMITQTTADANKAAEIKALEDDIAKQKQVVADYEAKNSSMTWSGIWQDDVTIKDYPDKMAAIQSKMDYFDNKIKQAVSNGDTAAEAKFVQLKDDLTEFKDYGEMYYDELMVLQGLENDLTSVANTNIISVSAETYSKAAKDAAKWFIDRKPADDFYRPKIAPIWRSMTDKEKDAVYKYTAGSGAYNRPLAGYEGSWSDSAFKGIGKANLNYEGGKEGIRLMQDVIDRCLLTENAWFQRGMDDDAFRKMLGVKSMRNLSTTEMNKLVGTTFMHPNFMSCGTSKGTGFGGVILNVYCPKGTPAMYSEPWSHYGGEKYGSGGRHWDGKTGQQVFGGEFETIIQRGATCRITRLEKSGYNVYMDIEIRLEEGFKKGAKV